MRHLKLIPLMSILAISLLVSLGSVQSVSARGRSRPNCKVRYFTYTVFIADGTATASPSSLDWLEGTPPEGCYPISWWDGTPFVGPGPDSDYYRINGIHVCYGDWCMNCATKEGNFRYRWWIYWNDDVLGNPEAQCLGGFFIFSHGSVAFDGIWAFGKAWVEFVEEGYPWFGYPFGYQYHVGLMFGGP